MEDQNYTPREAAALVLAVARKRLEAGIASLQKAEELGKTVHGLPTMTPSAKAVSDGDGTAQPKHGRTVFKMLAARKAAVQKGEASQCKCGEKSCAACCGDKAVKKSEVMISTENGADTIKRYVEKGKQGVVPGDKKSKEVSAEGSGGSLEKADDNLASPTPAKPPKPEKGAALKPAGVPGAAAGKAPSIPKPPAAPGAKGMTMKNEKCGVFARLEKKKGGK